MPLLNILLLSKYKLFSLVTSIIVIFLCLLPLIRNPQYSIYYSIDPDVVYLANALSNIKHNIVGYYDHPGTIAISFITLVLAPLRIFAKYIVHESFTTWAFNNYDFLVFYVRVLMSILYGSGIFIILNVVFKITKSYLSQIFTILILGSYLPFYYAGISISAEPVSLFLISVWLLVFSYYYKSKNINFWFLLVFISGILLANRATNFFYIPAAFISLFLNKKILPIKKLINISLKGFGLFLTGLVVGLWPLGDQIFNAIKRIVFFAISTKVHGAGDPSFFDLSVYIESAQVFLISYPIASMIFFLVFIYSIYKVFSRNSKEIIIWSLSLIFCLGMLIFAKFPLAHYQIGNFVFIAVAGAIIYSKLSLKLKWIILILVLIKAVPMYQSFYNFVEMTGQKTSKLDQYRIENPSRTGEVWEWARHKNFAAIWTRSWGSGVFDDEIGHSNPKILELMTGGEKLRTSTSSQINIFDVCWDRLYIQAASLDSFLNIHKKRNLIVEEIKGSDGIMSISSNHCITKP